MARNRIIFKAGGNAKAQEAMKKEKPLPKEEIISEFLGEIIWKVGGGLGINDTKRLPNGKQVRQVIRPAF